MAATTQTAPIPSHAAGLFANARTDTWWVGPLLTFLGFTGFVAYSTWAGLQGVHYFRAPYLSPMYSPLLWIKSGVAGGAPVAEAWFGEWPSWLPAIVPVSPAVFIVGFPLAFRFTCYYYRKAYYRSFALTPPGCAVAPIQRKKFMGEKSLLIFQNLHRYALYFALIFVVILSVDAVRSFFKDGKFGIGVGSIVLTINPILIGLYTFGCHSLRHLVGGRLDCYSCDAVSGARYTLWKKITSLNERHMLFAWMSLFWVGWTDLYVRLVSMGVLHDFNTWGS